MNRQSEVWLFKQIESIYMHFIGAKNTIIGIITTRIFIASLLLLGAFAIYFTGYLIEHNNPASLSTVMNDFYINLSSELLGIVITVLLIDTFSAIRQIRNEKESLALQVKKRAEAVSHEILHPSQIGTQTQDIKETLNGFFRI